MFKYLLFILFSIFLNGDFIKSVFLEDVKFIKFINISFNDKSKNLKKQFINMNSTFLENEIIFSETRQDMLLGSFILKNPLGVRSLRIAYFDSNDESREKVAYIDKGSISSKQLYFYEKKDYLYDQNDIVYSETGKLIFEHNLPIAYDDKDSFIDIAFKKCNDDNEDCGDIKFRYWDKRVIFYLKFKTTNDRKMNLSKNIKRIQIINKDEDEYLTWMIVEAKKKIEKIKKLDGNNAKSIVYRVYID